MCFQKENNILSIPTDFHTISVTSFKDDAEVISTISFYEKELAKVYKKMMKRRKEDEQ